MKTVYLALAVVLLVSGCSAMQSVTVSFAEFGDAFEKILDAGMVCSIQINSNGTYTLIPATGEGDKLRG